MIQFYTPTTSNGKCSVNCNHGKKKSISVISQDTAQTVGYAVETDERTTLKDQNNRTTMVVKIMWQCSYQMHEHACLQFTHDS